MLTVEGSDRWRRVPTAEVHSSMVAFLVILLSYLDGRLQGVIKLSLDMVQDEQSLLLVLSTYAVLSVYHVFSTVVLVVFESTVRA